VPPAARAGLASALFAAGLPHVEVAAFVSPKAVPAMAEASEVVAAVEPPSGATVWVLVPNRRGAEMAKDAGVDHLTVTISASPAYSQTNVGMTVDESAAQVGEVRAVAAGGVVDAVISCAFGSPFGDEVSPPRVRALVERMRAVGVDQVTLADTTGVATPRRIAAVLDEVGADIGLHLHDTRGTALVNAYATLEMGVRRFDASLGGLGGSPFAPGAGGNLATEDLVLLLEDLGVGTGIDLGALLAAGRDLAALTGLTLPSRVAAAGPLPEFAEG
jgi:hydroxymethylglutaryl-CoA lyase